MFYTKDWFSNNVKLCQTGLYSLAISMLRNEEDAKDAVQETLYKAYDNLSTLKEPEKFKPWIMKILTNTAYEMLRKRKYTLNIDEYSNIPENANSIDLSTKITLWQAVESLNMNQRTVLILFYYESLSIKEISKVLGISQSAVKKRLSRGRMKLRQLLE